MPFMWEEETADMATAEKTPQKRTERKCGACGATFQPRTDGQRFCKAGCRAKGWRADHIIKVKARIGQIIHLEVIE